MYINLDDISKNTPITSVSSVSGDDIVFNVPNSNTNWTICKLDVSILKDDLINNYDLRVINKSNSLVKSLASSYEEHQSIDYQNLTVVDNNGSLSVQASSLDNSDIKMLVGNITIY